VNASGGINGHQVAVTVEDDKTTPGTAVDVANALVAQHVDAIVDDSVLGVLWATTVAPSNIPVIGSNGTDTPFETNPDFYSQGGTIGGSVTSYLEVAKQAGAKSFGYIYCAEAPQCAQLVPPLKSTGQTLGEPDIYNASVSATAPNYTAQCVAAQQAHVGALFLGEPAPIAVRIATDCSQQNYHPIYVLPGQSLEGTLITTKAINQSTWYPFVIHPYTDTSFAGVKAFDAAMDKYFPGVMSDPNVFSQTAADAWPSGILLADAVKAGGLTASDTPSAAEIVKGLTSLNGDTLEGWSPPITFKAGGAHPNDCWMVGKMTNGTLSLLDNGKISCAGS
jgi:branched-chain amino acid transport system substrate-binding protein